MKLITKLLTLLAIFLLVPSLTLATGSNDTGNVTVSNNVTPIVNNQVIVNNNIVTPTQEKVIVKEVTTKPKAPITPTEKNLPSRDEVLAFAQGSNATDNLTLENQLIAHNVSWYWDTYSVKTKDGKEYSVVVVYDNEKTKTNYGRVQLYAESRGIGLVQPTPMFICRQLNITALDGSWTFKTATVKS